MHKLISFVFVIVTPSDHTLWYVYFWYNGLVGFMRWLIFWHLMLPVEFCMIIQIVIYIIWFGSDRVQKGWNVWFGRLHETISLKMRIVFVVIPSNILFIYSKIRWVLYKLEHSSVTNIFREANQITNVFAKFSLTILTFSRILNLFMSLHLQTLLADRS